MKITTTLILLTGMGLVAASQAQTPPSPTETERNRATPVPARAPTLFERAATAQGNRPALQMEHDADPSRHDPSVTRADGIGNGMAGARQERDAARLRCQSAGDAHRQPCLDRADQDYATNVREMDRNADDSRR